jgi:uncharacterized membrane protein
MAFVHEQVIITRVPIQTAARVVSFELCSIFEVPFLISAIVATINLKVVVIRGAINTESSICS